MSFHNVSFPLTLALGATGGPEWRADVVPLASGSEVRNTVWSRGRRRWDVGGAVTDLASLQTLVGFFEARSGPVHGFRFRDPLDHSSAAPGQEVACTDQTIGYGDGETAVFQLSKTVSGFTRDIYKPVQGSVCIGINGVGLDTGWSVNTTTGAITFESPPTGNDTVMAGFSFDVPVRFESDQMRAVIDAFGAGHIAEVTLVELWEPGL